MKGKLLITSLAINLLVGLLLVIGFFKYGYKERICQKWIDYNQEADWVMIGDSHTSYGNWNSLIKGKSVKKLAWGGWNSFQIRGQVEHALEYNPEIILIMAGANNFGGPCFDYDTLFEDYQYMVNILGTQDKKPIFQKLFYYAENPEFNKFVDTVNQRLEDFCDKNDVELIDISQGLYNGQALKRSMTYDGAHLNKEGYLIWAKNLENWFKKLDHP